MTRASLLAAAAILIPSIALAGDPLFVITGTSNGVPITPIGGDNIIDLVNNAVNNKDKFAALANTDASLSLSYGGVPNAITIAKNPANNFATLTLIKKDGTSITRTFDTTAPGDNGRSLQQLIEDYIKKGGSSDLKAFYQAINARSVIGVSDGNPNATTARLEDAIYSRFGRFNRMTAMTVPGSPPSPPDPTDPDAIAPAPPAADGSELQDPDFQLRIGVAGYAFNVAGFEGGSVAVSSSADWNFTPRVGFTVGSFLAYNTVGDANVYHGGIYFGVPLRPFLATPDQHWTWQITPTFGAAGSGSLDQAAGGVVYSFAGTSLLRWQTTPNFALELSNQAGYLQGKAIEVADFRFDSGVQQWVLKNGIEAQYMFGESGWYGYGGGSYTDFLDDASIKGWISPSIGIGWRKPSLQGTSFELGFLGDFGDGWKGYGLRAGINIAF